MRTKSKNRYRKILSNNRKLSLLLAVLLGYRLLTADPAQAAPSGGVVTSGNAAISQAGSVTTVNQSTPRASINWQSFSTKPNETVNFNQPNSQSLTLNRVIGNEKSVLDGVLNATGKVFLLNSNGILMGKGSTVNTAGFVASTLNLSDEDFNAGTYTFKANGSTGSVINLGTITARDGGYVALLGTSVSNQGIISATRGTIALTSGDKITLNFGGDSLVSVTIDEGTLNGLVENRQAVYADGGKVFLTARAADDLLGAQVNTSGIIQARTIGDLKGHIELFSHGGRATVDGTLDASAPAGGDGGFIETSGDKVTIADSAVVTTRAQGGQSGTWLIDPDGFTIGTNRDMSATALTTALTNGSVIIESTNGSGTDGNINVNEAVSWSANTLTLTATNNIFVNAVMSATGSAGLVANYGTGTNADGTPMGLYTYLGSFTTTAAFIGRIDFSGSGGVTLNGTPYTVITDKVQLVTVADLTGNYVLGSNISMNNINDIAPWNGIVSGTFTGNFNGFGHSITGTINSATTGTGLFGTIATGSVVSNLQSASARINADASPSAAVGVLANYNSGSIVNSFASSSILGAAGNGTENFNSVGALVGSNAGLIAQSHVFAPNIYATNIAGGLVGINEATGRIIDSSATYTSSTTSNGIKNTTAANTISWVGGLAGINHGSIERSYSTIQLVLSDTTSMAGAFVGLNTGTIDQSYAARPFAFSMAQYSTGPYLAGFVYENQGTITNAYTTALYNTNATPKWDAGFAYLNSGTISDAYAMSYSGNSTTPTRYGFVSANSGAISDAYWYSGTGTGATVAVDVTPNVTHLSGAAAATYASYGGFDPSVWGVSESGYPILRNMLLYINSKPAPSVYGTTGAGNLLVAPRGMQGGVEIGSLDLVGGSNIVLATDSNGYMDAGSWNAVEVVSSPVYSNIKGVVVITQKPLVISLGGVTASVADKEYDGTTGATVSLNKAPTIVSGLVAGQEGAIIVPTGVFADKNAGQNKTVTVTYSAGGSAKAENYNIATTSTAQGNILPKVLTAAVTGAEKVYDGGTNAASAITWTLPGTIAGDSLALTYGAAFADGNAGTGKSVTVIPLTLTGADSGNYTLNTAPLTTTAAITPRPLALYGVTPENGSTTVGGSNIRAANQVAGDTVTFSGSVTIAGTAAGPQAITDWSALTMDNPNYTLVGSVAGNVYVGSANLMLDKVAGGTAVIDTSVPNTTTITTSDKAVIDWLSFSLAAGETLSFVQPATTSIVLNRVTTDLKSVINGTLNANGRVFILNSNGVLFAAGSRVSTAGLVASSLNLSDTDFLSDHYVFTAGAGSSGPVVAAGDIVIVDGGLLVLASNNGVETAGSITAPGATTLLAATKHLTLTPGTADHTVADLEGTVTVGGTVNLGSGLLATAGTGVTNSAAAVTADTWSWTLPTLTIGGGGTLTGAAAGSGLGQYNLTLTALGGDVAINDPLTWGAGTRLTLNALGGDITVNNAISAGGAGAALVLNAAGTLTVDAPVTAGGSSAALRLTAGEDIVINRSITADGSGASLALNHGGDYRLLTRASYSGTVPGAGGWPVANTAPAGTQYAAITLSGAGAGLTINGTTYTLIHSMAELAALDDATGTATGHFALASDLNAGGTTYTTSPLANLSGTLAGLGHVINNLTINSSDSFTGLINQVGSNSTIRDIGVVNASVTGYGGILAARLEGGTLVSQAYSSGTISQGGGLIGNVRGDEINRAVITDSYSDAQVGWGGGLLRQAIYASVVRSHATGSVASGGTAGGLIGYAEYGTITDSYATGNVGSTALGSDTGIAMGGLVGNAGEVTILNSFATGNVWGSHQLGGLVGRAAGSALLTIENSYATGSVTSTPSTTSAFSSDENGVGGLVGIVGTGGSIVVDHSYASGHVTIQNSFVEHVGGLIGLAGSSIDGASATIINSHASGNVTAEGSNYVGGLVGVLHGTISNSYATGNVAGNARASFITGTGGLVGSMHSSTIVDSYASGLVSGYSAGGLAGGAARSDIFGSYWNRDTNLGALGMYAPETSVNNSQGLTTTQFANIEQYRNGTLDPVAPAPVAPETSARRQEEAADTARQLAGQAAREQATRPVPVVPVVTAAGQPASIDSRIIYADSAEYGADIESIDADGVRYDLHGGAGEKNEDESEDKDR